MPVNKDFKRLVRARMQKTGESYTAARRHFLNGQPSAISREPGRALTGRARRDVKAFDSFGTAPSAGLSPRSAVQSLGPDPAEYARIAGMSDQAVKAKTGCTWKSWVGALDYVEANTWSHRAIAEYVREKYQVPSWWTQMVTVGYERIRGLRARGQRRDGEFEASKSKVFALPPARLYRALSDARARSRWLPGVDLKVRTAIKNKSLRITWPDGTLVEAYVVPKGPAKSQLVVQHRRLKSHEDVTRLKTYWAERFSALTEVAAR
jgi:hypothetical protein